MRCQLSALVKSNKQEVRLVIVGEGQFRQRLERLASELQISNKLLFLGNIDHAKIPMIINACDICIAPFTSWRNGKIGVSPLKLYEYLSCGKPVVSTSILGTEIIRDLDAGIRAT